MSLYFVNNNFDYSFLARSIDFYIPMSITRLSDKYSASVTQDYPGAFLQDIPNTQYIRFIDRGLLEVQINFLTKELIALTIVSSNKMTINNSLWQTSLPALERTIALTSPMLTKHYDTYTPYDIHKDCRVELYPNALLVKIPQGGQSCYFVCEKDTLGVITDENFVIKSFVILNLERKEVNELLEYEKSNSTSISQDYYNNKSVDYTKCNVIMNNTQVLIDKLFELENVNVWQVLYYGLHRFLIDTAFCVKYAEAYLTYFDKASVLVIELAELVPHEYHQVYTLFERLVSDKDIIMNNNAQMFNKIWLYLHLAIDMHTLKLTS